MEFLRLGGRIPVIGIDRSRLGTASHGKNYISSFPSHWTKWSWRPKDQLIPKINVDVLADDCYRLSSPTKDLNEILTSLVCVRGEKKAFLCLCRYKWHIGGFILVAWEHLCKCWVDDNIWMQILISHVRILS